MERMAVKLVFRALPLVIRRFLLKALRDGVAGKIRNPLIERLMERAFFPGYP